jgi:hypothetical protein
MRLPAILLAASLVSGGCVANTYRIPNGDLAQLAQTQPEARGQKVRVIQEIGSGTVVNNTERVGPDTQVIFVPQINISTGPRYTRGGYSSGGVRTGGGGGKIGGGGGSGSDGKAAAIAVLVIAAAALFVVAGIEGSRYDGHAQLHPMHPVHLIGKDGGYTIMPLAWIDPQAAAWTEKAIVRPQDGPWTPLGRAPLYRRGWSYGMYGGTGTMISADGTNGAGPSFVVQLGGYFNQHVGLFGNLGFAWRENSVGGTLFESRYMLELQAMPLQAGILHAGGYVGAGWAYRYEDDVGTRRGNNGTEAFSAGAMLQLDINTRLALTARLGITKAHEVTFGSGAVTDRMHDVIFGLAVY